MKCIIFTKYTQQNINLLAVHIANNICMESKKKNITNNDIEAPKGKHNACIVSKVWTSVKKRKNTLFNHK